MRIVLIRQNYRPDGGAERFVVRAAEALGTQGVDMVLLARNWPGDVRGLRVERCNPYYVGTLWRDIGFARGVCRRLPALAADLVQAHERIPCCDVFRAGDGTHREWLIQRRRTMGPWGRVRLWMNPRHAYTLWMERRTFLSPRLKAVICGSRMVRDEIARHFPIDPQKLVVLYNGVDCERFHPRVRDERGRVREELGVTKTQKLFLFVGSGFYRKGLPVAIEALAATENANASLLVVGRDKHWRRYARLAAQRGVGERVRFVGAQNDPLPYYGAADALVLPALYDPSPNVILEAMACGLPVVASRQCGSAELLTEGVSGFVRDALDVGGFRDALARLLEPGAADRMGAAARDAIEPYDLAHMSARFIGFYRGLLAGTPPKESA
ncbi:MAG: glycosyltransferase family 4 protein [Gammaproteobacteria bacterium]|nr:glycosyltransferase family 4 protein [Gammaproteobacteria bacterium]